MQEENKIKWKTLKVSIELHRRVKESAVHQDKNIKERTDELLIAGFESEVSKSKSENKGVSNDNV